MKTPTRARMTDFDDRSGGPVVMVFPRPRRTFNQTLMVFGMALASAMLLGGCSQLSYNPDGTRHYSSEVVPVSASMATTVATRIVASVAPAGPGTVTLECFGADGMTRTVLTWENPGFTAVVVVNGAPVVLDTVTATSLGSSAAEADSGHGACSGTVDGVTRTGSY